MTRALFLTFVALLCLPAAPAQAKSRKPLVGFGEQSQWIFSDERWFTLENNHRHYIRYVMPWNALRYESTRALVDAWMSAARRRHARVVYVSGITVRLVVDARPSAAAFSADHGRREEVGHEHRGDSRLLDRPP